MTEIVKNFLKQRLEFVERELGCINRNIEETESYLDDLKEEREKLIDEKTAISIDLNK